MNVQLSNGDGGQNIEKPIAPQTVTTADRMQPGQVLNRTNDVTWI